MSDLSKEEAEEFKDLVKIDLAVSHPFFKGMSDQATLIMVQCFGFLDGIYEEGNIDEQPEVLNLYGTKDGRPVKLFIVTRTEESKEFFK